MAGRKNGRNDAQGFFGSVFIMLLLVCVMAACVVGWGYIGTVLADMSQDPYPADWVGWTSFLGGVLSLGALAFAIGAWANKT